MPLGFAVVAIDLSAPFVQPTKQRVPAADVRKMDMRHLEFPAGTFDGVWCCFSLLHFREEEIGAALSGFKSVLKPWRASFLCPAPRAANRVVKAIISGMEREIYVQEWDQKDIEAIVRKAGFGIIQSRPFLRERGRFPVLSLLMHT